MAKRHNENNKGEHSVCAEDLSKYYQYEVLVRFLRVFYLVNPHRQSVIRHKKSILNRCPPPRWLPQLDTLKTGSSTGQMPRETWAVRQGSTPLLSKRVCLGLRAEPHLRLGHRRMKDQSVDNISILMFHR